MLAGPGAIDAVAFRLVPDAWESDDAAESAESSVITGTEELEAEDEDEPRLAPEFAAAGFAARVSAGQGFGALRFRRGRGLGSGTGSVNS